MPHKSHSFLYGVAADISKPVQIKHKLSALIYGTKGKRENIFFIIWVNWPFNSHSDTWLVNNRQNIINKHLNTTILTHDNDNAKRTSRPHLLPSTSSHKSASAAACVHLSSRLYLYKLTFSSSSHVFQLICSPLAQQSDLNHLIGVSIWVPNRPWGPPAWLCNGWLCIDNTMQPLPIRPHQPPSHTSHQCLVMFDCVVFYILLFYIFSSFLLFFIHACLPRLLLLLVLSASSIIVLQRHAQAGRGVQWRRAPGDPRSAFQFAGCQVIKKKKQKTKRKSENQCSLVCNNS